MSDPSSLRSLLSQVDMSAPAIQSCAAQMIKHYDRSAGVAVVEWRNSLANATRTDQWLGLLYVANEVLQTSKRNRGNKFLEAFSPILGQALIHVCQQSDGSVVEKIRRTVKIWGDRRVFSVRYVNELLKGLEPYRRNGPGGRDRKNNISEHAHSSPGAGIASPAGFSPEDHGQSHTGTSNAAPATPSTKASPDELHPEAEEDEDPMDILNAAEAGSEQDEDEEDDDDDVFPSSEAGGLKLDVSIDFESSALQSPQPSVNKKRQVKRRRSSTASAGSQSSAKRRQRKAILSTNGLLELWGRVSSLQQRFDHSQAMLQEIQGDNNDGNNNGELPDEALVGDELLDRYRQILQHEERVAMERATLHRIATERRVLESEAIRYLPWLETALNQDGDDLVFCQNLLEQLLKFNHVHDAIRAARNKRVEEQLRFQQEQEERERKRKEEEESKKFREAALSKETEAKPGMVWNKVTQEYQYVNTDESWRD